MCFSFYSHPTFVCFLAKELHPQGSSVVAQRHFTHSGYKPTNRNQNGVSYVGSTSKQAGRTLRNLS